MHTLNISGERKLSKQRHNKNKVGVAIFKEFFCGDSCPVDGYKTGISTWCGNFIESVYYNFWGSRK